MRPALAPPLIRRVLYGVLLVWAVSSASLVLVHLAPGDAFSGLDVEPAVAEAERARLGLDRPFVEQYGAWAERAITLDFGESTLYRRPVAELVGERLLKTVMLGVAALALALAIGLPAGVISGSEPNRILARVVRAISLVFVSIPPLVTSLVLLLIAVRTGWLPAGGFDRPLAAGVFDEIAAALRFLPLPALALGLPIAASLERLQSRAIADALHEPSILAARARGISASRATWIHAWRLSLTPVLGILGIVIGTVLSGSLIVEVVMSWPGLGSLMLQALRARDLYLAAGCASAGAVFLALALSVTELALQFADPRRQETV